MARPLEILDTAGFLIQDYTGPKDPSPWWQLSIAVDDIPNTNITRRTWDGLKDEDLIGKDVLLCYSWGVASTMAALTRLLKAGKIKFIPLLIIVAGVPRGFSQWILVALSGGWFIPDEVGMAVCLQVDSIPQSYPIRNSGTQRVNILLTGIDGNDHVNVQNFPEAHEYVVSLITAAAEHVGT